MATRDTRDRAEKPKRAKGKKSTLSARPEPVPVKPDGPRRVPWSWAAAGLGAVGLVAVGAYALRSTPGDAPKTPRSRASASASASASARGPVVKPGADKLVVRARVEALEHVAHDAGLAANEPGAPGYRLHLEIQGGAIALDLRPPKRAAPEQVDDGYDFDMLWSCAASAPDRAKGAAFVEAVAAWLGAPVPEPPGGAPRALEEVACSWSPSGETPTTQVRGEASLGLGADPQHSVEVLVRVADDQRAAAIAKPADDETSRMLVEQLALELRDGLEPRRSVATHPAFASDAPLVAAPARLAGGDVLRGSKHDWAGATLVTVTRGEGARVRAWGDLAKPAREAAALEGCGDGLFELDHAGARLAAAVVAPPCPDPDAELDDDEEHEEGHAPAPPAPVKATVVIADLATGATKRLEGYAGATSVAWSPDDGELAVLTGPRKARELVIVDAATGRETRRQRVKAPNRELGSWSRAGVLLRDTRAELEEQNALVTPTGGAPKPLASTSPLVDPPKHAVFKLDASEKLVKARDDQGREAKLEAVTELDGESFAHLALTLDQASLVPWLGPSRVLLELDSDVLDLRTMKMRPLVPRRSRAAPPLELLGASPDGALVLLAVGDAVYWGKASAE